MKYLTLLLITCLSITSNGQDKYNYVHFNKLTEVVGTGNVIASIENWGKRSETNSKYLLFIDTKTGAGTQVDFPNGASIGTVEQVKHDTLGFHLILVSARTLDLDGKSGIDWNDPTQIIVLSPDGKQKTQLTDDKFFARTWVVNRTTGTIVVTGHFDTNNNGKYDKTDKNEIHIYDLKKLKLVAKI